ncbi:hypothetical protein [Shewanella phage FishSpeaker]|nr:hypothetical protein [Shewanella phage FishSpeaker]
MIINPHDSLPGKIYKVTEQVEQTIKTLELTSRLVETTKKNVFCIDHSVMAVPPFSFPITLKTNYGEWITVYDKRPFISKSNAVLNIAEEQMMRICAYLQQDAVIGNVSILKSTRYLVVKGFVSALASALVRRAGLNVEEETALKALLVFYWVCISENHATTNLHFVADNIARETQAIQSASLFIEEVEPMLGINDLLKEIKNHPMLFKLHKLDLKDFLSVISKLAFSSVGPHVISAAAECPCLMTALTYAILNNNIFAKTNIGMVIDQRRDKQRIEEMTKTLNYAYDI